MAFLRRLTMNLRGPSGSVAPTAPDATAAPPKPDMDSDEAERTYELELLRDEQSRLDELGERQLRYAAYAWQPPAQGGSERADDEGAAAD